MHLFLHPAVRFAAVLLAGLLATGAYATPPSYNSTNQHLYLPWVRSGDVVYPDVEITLSADGTWALYRVGIPRPAQETDDNSAILDAATSTLSLQDVHVGGRVYGDVRLQLANQHWQIDGTPQPMVALNEDDFVSDPALAASPDNVVILKLEARPGDGTVADTGGAGTDPSTKFPLQLSAGDYQFCFDAESDGADGLTLFNAQGVALLSMKAGDPCLPVTLPEGRYWQAVQYGGVSGEAHTVFVRQDNSAQGFAAAQNAARAVIAARDCIDCKLMMANFSHYDFTGRRFDGANFYRANLSRSILDRASLRKALLVGANLKNASLYWADLDSASFIRADLSGAVLYGAKLSNTLLDGANLSGAIWIDGRKCGKDQPPYSGQCLP